ncbi:hypothetical protein DL93DRAFT_2119068 [Clavulina sp. PMI_390]|nr:hypothetical protein DL93DRAFT_2119068 [Clavulina sp. PMI_390]
MTQQISRKGKEPVKTQKINTKNSPATFFRSRDDIQKALSADSQESLKIAVQSLRNQFTIQEHEFPIASSDERLLLAQQWLEDSTGASELFDIWETSNQNATMTALCISTLASILTLLSTHYIYHPLADPIIRRLHEQQWMRKLSTNLTASQHELILVTLKLFNALVNFADGREKRAVMEEFSWGLKSLPKLFTMRRKGPRANPKESLSKPDIRTLFLQFLLSFTSSTTPSPIKAALLEEHKDLFTGIFKGLHEDPYEVVRYVLEACWDGVWGDAKIARTTKIRLFSEGILAQLVKLYSRTDSESDDAEDIPADLIHHFLLAITTRPGAGLCFHDRGWYPRSNDQDTPLETSSTTNEGDGDSATAPGGNVYNKILRNFLRTLKVNEDARQQELALKILTSCPELVQGYWSSASISFEPRLSSRWITNVSFFGSVLSTPIPIRTFGIWDPKMPSTSTNAMPTSYHPSPPPLAGILENIIPAAFTKEYISKGLLSFKEPLVTHCTGLALAKMLTKFDAVRAIFSSIESELEEDAENGQWYKRRLELEKQISRRVPEFQVIIAVSQRFVVAKNSATHSEPDNAMEVDGEAGPHDTATHAQRAMLHETALRLMWLYHQLLPSLVAETKFDAGKLLASVEDSSSTSDNSMPSGLDALGRLHVLRLLQSSNQFSWTAKQASSPHSQLHSVMMLSIDKRGTALGSAATSLVAKLLSRSVLFEHDEHEPLIWLDALPTRRRSTSVKAPDGTALTDEPSGVIAFLDECILRCIKTPYSYVEKVLDICYGPQASSSPASTLRSPSFAPGPLLAASLEQIAAKTNKSLLRPSDALAIISYIRRVLVTVLGKQPEASANLRLLRAFHGIVDHVRFSQHASMELGVRREVRLIERTINAFSSSTPVATTKSTAQNSISAAAVATFLDALEETPEDQPSKEKASELVDWVRVVDPPLDDVSLGRLWSLVTKWAPSVDYGQELLTHFEPGANYLHAFAASDAFLGSLSHRISVSYAILLYRPQDPQEQEVGSKIIQALHSASIDEESLVTSCRLLLMLHSHRTDNLSTGASTIFFSQLISGISLPSLRQRVKRLVFMENEAIKAILLHPPNPLNCESYLALIRNALDPSSSEDRAIAQEYCNYWCSALSGDLQPTTIAALAAWVPFLDDPSFSIILDAVDSIATSPSKPHTLDVFLEALAIVLRTQPSRMPLVISRLPSLLGAADSLQSPLLHSTLVDVASTATPLGLDLSLPRFRQSEGHGSLSHSIAQASLRWGYRFHTHTTRPVSETSTNISLILSVYDPSASSIAIDAGLMSYPEMLPSLQASLESAAEVNPDGFRLFIPSLVRSATSRRSPPSERNAAANCLLAAYNWEGCRELIQSELIEELRSLPFEHFFRARLHQFLLRLIGIGEQPSPVLTVAVDRGLRLAVDQFADVERESQKDLDGFSAFAHLVRRSVGIKAHLAEPALTAGIASRMEVPAIVMFLAALCEGVNLKPVNSNRLLQGVLQHPSFFVAARSATSSSPAPATRKPIVELIYTLFMMNPSNASQPSHIIPLAKVYGGTMDTTDLRLRELFQEFESLRSLSATPLFQHWSATAVGTSTTLLDAIISLDPSTVTKSFTKFPTKTSGRSANSTGGVQDPTVYDPRFLLSLLSGLLSDGKSEGLSHIDWINVFRSNIISVALRALASREDDVRDSAAQALFILGHTMAEADFQERDEVLLLLRLARDAMTPPLSQHGDEIPASARLSTIHALLLAHGLRCIFYPSNSMYPLIMQFLLQRPELDTRDVPMLFASLYSTSDEWRQERAWFLRFIADGMTQSQDWKILGKRHVWALLATMFQESPGGKQFRRGVLDVLGQLANHSRAIMALVIQGDLLSWIQLQLMEHPHNEEAPRWLSILSNIVLNVDHTKCDTAMAESWRTPIISCLLAVHAVIGSSIDSLHTIVFAIRRLLESSPSSSVQLEAVIMITEGLSRSEHDIPWSEDVVEEVRLQTSTLSRSSSPSRSRSVLILPASGIPPLLIWGQCVEMLWECVMKPYNNAIDSPLPSSRMSNAWNALTSRLLLWNAISRTSEVGEWARRETIRQMRLQAQSPTNPPQKNNAVV